MKKILVLGAGLVGKAIVLDLAKTYSVTAVDNRQTQLDALNQIKPDIKTINTELTRDSIQSMVREFDLVVNALPGHMGFEALKAIIKSRKNCADISFFPQEPSELDHLAQTNQVSAVIDCGVAPGLSNMILGYHDQEMDVEQYACYVGGLPENPQPPFFYKAPFSPIDVLEEYTRPCRLKVNGEIIIREALTESEWLEFPQVGRLEAFNTDGLRTLLHTMSIPNMKEKTLRYSGHRKQMQLLKDSGFFDSHALEIDGKKIKPIDYAAKLIFPHWKLAEDEKEFTVMRILISGQKEGRPVSYEYNLFDRFDPVSKTSSMARTTGYTCTGVVKLLLENRINQKGIIAPELVGRDHQNYSRLIDHLEKRNISIIKNTK